MTMLHPQPNEADELDQAVADVTTARAVVEALRRRVALGQEGASALSTAEWKLHAALNRLNQLRARPPADDDPDAA